MKRSAGGFMPSNWWMKRHKRQCRCILKLSMWFDGSSHKKHKTQPSESRNIAWEQIPHTRTAQWISIFSKLPVFAVSFRFLLSRITFSAQKYNGILCWANYSILKENRSFYGISWRHIGPSYIFMPRTFRACAFLCLCLHHPNHKESG